MRILKYPIFFVLILSHILSCRQLDTSSKEHQNTSQNYPIELPSADTLIQEAILLIDSEHLEIPKYKQNEKVIYHSGYALVYNEYYEQADWIAYELTSFETKRIVSRSNKFCEDPNVSTQTATITDYKNSGYDRGHLAPAADMGWSLTAMNESFYFSNISPQVQSFNRGIWKRLEELVRFWAQENASIYIATGPILSRGLPTIGPNKVAVPKYFYKVILDYSKPDLKGIGFIIPNTGSNESLQNFAVSIDSVEQLTSLDFFPKLPDLQEKLIESKLCVSCWTWNKATYHSNSSNSNTVQCRAITKAGSRCKRMTRNANSQCTQHNKY